MEKSTLIPLIFLGLLLNYPWMISATRSDEFSDHNTLSSSNKKSTITVNHPNKISSHQQYMVDFHDVPSGPNSPIHYCGDDIC
ncbi:hypothetical protein EJD97_016821 [Solanum chilense]|uniref:Uncharacterized protein n=1 Tax=Solanum chilense TaxID=4083 RepID=A0A6N2B6Y6_SOLCI|nr:hypothetical protein EJD97_016821 [Solanum chilense]